jgi:sarcosine oxidase
VRGESQDHSRIIRLSYHAPNYVRLAKRAYESWATLEAESDTQVILKTGGLDLGPRSGAIPLQGYADAMTACGVPFERLDSSEIMRRWPQFTLTDDIDGLFQADGGIAMAARANETHRQMARAKGAVLRDNAPVESIDDSGGEIEIRAGGTSYRCSKLVIAAGPWTNHALANFDVHMPLEITKEQVTYFAARDAAAFAPERFPVWIWMDDPSFYGFPAFGEAGPKVAQDAGGKPVDPDSRTFEPDAENFARVEGFLRRYLPAALGPVIYTKTCLYTLTPDRDFVIDFVPGHSNISFAIGAGHAFKFASVIGRILGELVADGATPSDIGAFRAGREILTMTNPPKSYMV